VRKSAFNLQSKLTNQHRTIYVYVLRTWVVEIEKRQNRYKNKIATFLSI